MKKFVLIVMLLLAAYIFPFCIEYAFSRRGYLAIGGEYLIFVYPFVIVSIWDSVKSFLKEHSK